MPFNSNLSTLAKTRAAASIFLHDVGKGVFTLTHSSLAMLGLVVVMGLSVALFRPDILAHKQSRRFMNGFARANSVCGGSRKTPPNGPPPPI
ncbi:MAG: Membrane-bound lytic murein transglycosylase [Pseudomonadota bacterium]